MTVSNLQLAVDSAVSANDAKLIRVGAPVVISQPDLGITANGEVTQIASTPGTNGVDPQRFYLEVTPKDAPAALVGTSVVLTITVDSTETDVLAVPVAGAVGGGRRHVARRGEGRRRHDPLRRRHPWPHGQGAGRRRPGRSAGRGRPRDRRHRSQQRLRALRRDRLDGHPHLRPHAGRVRVSPPAAPRPTPGPPPPHPPPTPLGAPMRREPPGPHRPLAVAVAVGTALVLLAACGGGGSSNNGDQVPVEEQLGLEQDGILAAPGQGREPHPRLHEGAGLRLHPRRPAGPAGRARRPGRHERGGLQQAVRVRHHDAVRQGADRRRGEPEHRDPQRAERRRQGGLRPRPLRRRHQRHLRPGPRHRRLQPAGGLHQGRRPRRSSAARP